MPLRVQSGQIEAHYTQSIFSMHVNGHVVIINSFEVPNYVIMTFWLFSENWLSMGTQLDLGRL